MKLLNGTLKKIEPADPEMRRNAEEYIRDLTMPLWALGRVLDLAVDLAGITGNLKFSTERKEIVLMAGDHGIVRQGVCPQGSEVTAQMMRNFIAGGACINAVAKAVHAHVSVVDMGVKCDLNDPRIRRCKVGYGTADFSCGPAMTREQAIRSIEYGIELANELAPRTDVFGTGEMGIGNTSPSTAIVTVLSRETDPAPYAGRGAGLAPEKLVHKAEIIRRGIALNSPDPDDGLDVLAKVGGFEIGGIAGLILGAAANRKPVTVDGFISSAGALIAAALSPAAKDFMILAHGSTEPGHRRMAELLGKKPLLDLGMRLGEGTGAALAMPLLDAASSIMHRMSTFENAHVTDKGILR